MKTLLIATFAAVANTVGGYEIQWPAVGGGGGQSAGNVYALVGRFADSTGVAVAGGSYVLTSSPVDGAPLLPAENFAHWQYQHFSPAELADPNVSGPGRDIDGDQMGNLLDFAVDGNPKGGDAALQLSLSFAPDALGQRARITLGRNPAARGITLVIEGSDDHVVWRTLASSVDGGPASGSALVDEIRGPFPLMVLEEPATLRRRGYRARAVLNGVLP